jgi:hypothetical protein
MEMHSLVHRILLKVGFSGDKHATFSSPFASPSETDRVLFQCASWRKKIKHSLTHISLSICGTSSHPMSTKQTCAHGHKTKRC